MAQRSAAAPSQRQLRVGEEIRHILAEILARGDLHDPVLAGRSITVSEVRPSPDLRNATAFVMPLAGVAEADVLAGLKRASAHLSHQVGRQLRVKFTPRLAFQLDRSFDEADRISRLLRTLEPGHRTLADSAAEGEADGETGAGDGVDGTAPHADGEGRD